MLTYVFKKENSQSQLHDNTVLSEVLAKEHGLYLKWTVTYIYPEKQKANRGEGAGGADLTLYFSIYQSLLFASFLAAIPAFLWH